MADLNSIQPNDGTGNTTGSHRTVGGTTSAGVPIPIRVDSSGNVQIGGTVTNTGSVTLDQPTTVTVSAIVTANGDVLAANANRIYAKIQNLDTEPLFIHEATGASATVFTEIAPADTAQDAGNSAPVFINSKGVISVYAAATARCKVTEYS